MYANRYMYGSGQTDVVAGRSILSTKEGYLGQVVDETNKPFQAKAYWMADSNLPRTSKPERRTAYAMPVLR